MRARVARFTTPTRRLAVLCGLGGLVALAGCGGADRDRPAAASTSTVALRPAGERVCRLDRLRLRPLFQGATGNISGVVFISAPTRSACALPPMSRIRVLNAAHDPLRVRQVTRRARETSTDAVPLSRRSAVERAAVLAIGWYDWCGPRSDAGPLLEVSFASAGPPVLLSFGDRLKGAYPRCDDPAGRAVSYVGVSPLRRP